MPGWLELWTTREQRQDGSGWGLVKQQIQQFEGCGVCPVQVFQDKEHRLMFGKFQEDGDDGFKCFLSLTLWGEIERRIAIFRKRQGK